MMNGLMILGMSIIVLGLIACLGLYYKIYYKNENRKTYIRFLLVLLLLFTTALGGFVAQAGANKSRLAFTDSELDLINSNKSFSDFTNEDEILFSALKSKYLLNEEDKVIAYHDIIFKWAVDQFLDLNKHRSDLSREDAEEFVLKDWKEKKEFYSEHK